MTSGFLNPTAGAVARPRVSAVTEFEVHHVRKLADLDRPGRPHRRAWVYLMAMRRRKTLVGLSTLP